MDSIHTTNVNVIENREIKQDGEEKNLGNIVVKKNQEGELGNNYSPLRCSSSFKDGEVFGKDFPCSTSPEVDEEVKQDQEVLFSTSPPVVIPVQEQSDWEPKALTSNSIMVQGKQLTRRTVRPPCSKVLGDMSYSDIIAMAIGSSEQKRMTLGQIYDWIFHNIPYFRKKTERSQIDGWKNAIRHTLSIRKRFIRLSNASSGCSTYKSWWTINPGAHQTRYNRSSDTLPAKQDVTRVPRVSRGTQTEEQYNVGDYGTLPTKQIVTRVPRVSRGTQAEEQYFLYVPQGVCRCRLIP